MSPKKQQAAQHGMRQCQQAKPLRGTAPTALSRPCPAREGVILQTLAPPEAILLIRPPEDYYDEEEVIVDPFRLGKIKVIERLRG
jgi:hypothetical protein